MKKNLLTIIITALAVLVITILAYLARPTAQKRGLAPGAQNTSAVLGAFTTNEMAYDFGPVSMAAGNVSRTFTIKNNNTEPIVISKLYTSCMCTTATLSHGQTRRGPFGMPGHGFIPNINEVIAPGEEAQIEVVFDPAAHGPAGVGRIDRIIYVENQNAPLLELRIFATVTP